MEKTMRWEALGLSLLEELPVVAVHFGSFYKDLLYFLIHDSAAINRISGSPGYLLTFSRSGFSFSLSAKVTWMMISDYMTVNGIALGKMEDDYIKRHHKHDVKDHQCSSSLVKHIKAPVHLVWSLVRRFDQPQRYKPFVSRCIVQGDLQIGSVREVNVKSGLPATTSTERLELLDDEEHIFRMTIVGGDHRLKNYSSIITVHPEVIDGRPGTMVIESFVVDVPDGNTKDETCYFVEALIKCNLKSLANVSEHLAVQDLTEPIDRI